MKFSNWQISENNDKFVFSLNDEGVNHFSCLVQGCGPHGASDEELAGIAAMIEQAPKMAEVLKLTVLPSLRWALLQAKSQTDIGGLKSTIGRIEDILRKVGEL